MPILKILAVAIFFIAPVLVTEVRGNDQLTSKELRIIRSISTVMLVSRKVEGDKRVRELKPLRRKLGRIAKSFDELRAAKPASRKVLVDKAGNIVPFSVIDDENPVLPEGVSLTTIQTPEAETRQYRLTQLKAKLGSLKVELEDQLPAFWELWHEETRIDRKRRIVVRTLEKVSERLDALDQDSGLNIEGLAEIESSLRPMLAPNDLTQLAPTFVNKTKHRKF